MGIPQGVLLRPHFNLSYLFRCQLLAGIAFSMLLQLAPQTQPGLIGTRWAGCKGLALQKGGQGKKMTGAQGSQQQPPQVYPTGS